MAGINGVKVNKMKVIELDYNVKRTEYRGIELYVPEPVECIAVDSDGTLVGFAYMPSINENLEIWDVPGCGSDEIYILGKVDLCGLDWKTTLAYI